MDKLYVIKIKDGMKTYEGFFKVTYELDMEGDKYITLENGDEVLFTKYASSNFFHYIIADTFMFFANTKEECHKYAKQYVIGHISYLNKELNRFQKANECLFP